MASQALTVLIVIRPLRSPPPPPPPPIRGIIPDTAGAGAPARSCALTRRLIISTKTEKPIAK